MYIPSFLRGYYDENGVRKLGKSQDYPIVKEKVNPEIRFTRPQTSESEKKKRKNQIVKPNLVAKPTGLSTHVTS